jgi:hypothetical protein
VASNDDPARRQELQSSFRSIVDISDRWLKRIKRRQLEVRLASAFLVLILIFFATLILDAAVLVFSAHLIGSTNASMSNNFNSYIQQHPSALFRLVGPAFLTAPVSALVTYFLLRWKHNRQLKELSSLTKQMKKRLDMEAPQQIKSTTTVSDDGIIDDAFSLTDKLLTLLPAVALRKRSLDSLLFGMVAFIFGTILSGNVAVAIVVGVVVWLYFRYETSRSYERDLARFEEQKRFYEQRKQDFIATL